MRLDKCPKEFNKSERRWWKFYFQVVTERGIMTTGKYSTLKDLCCVEAQIEHSMAILRDSDYEATYNKATYTDAKGVDHTKVSISPVARKLEDQMKLKISLKKALGLFEVPAESNQAKGLEGMLDG